jgi:ABC-type phosphate/phosphonate transport system permease subunit
MITILSALVSLLSFRVHAWRIKVVDAGLREVATMAFVGAFAAIYFAVLPSVLRSRSLHFQAEIVRLPPKSVP